jgi:hypothetical protein
MSSILSTIKATGAAAAVALMLAAGPALAQSGEPSANFSLNLGNGQTTLELGINSDQPQQGNFNRRGGGDNWNGGGGGFRDACLTDRQVIRGLRDYGFQRVEVADSNRRRAEVIGRWGRWDYLMRVSKCTGEVNILDRFRRNSRNGFGLEFNFN